MPTQTGELVVTFPDNTLQTTAAIAGAPGFGGFTNISVYTVTSFWIVPAGVTTCKVTVIGGGAGGGFGKGINTSPPSSVGGRGGGAGGAAVKIITGLTPGATINITVGAGGRGADAVTSFPVPATPGGTSSFGAFCSASGGAINSTGGIGFGGNLNIRGGPGSPAALVDFFVGIENISGTWNGGVGGSSILGGGGTVGEAGGAVGGAGGAYGGGGGGADGLGGNGASGVVIIEY